jgi:hypothetical protein
MSHALFFKEQDMYVRPVTEVGYTINSVTTKYENADFYNLVVYGGGAISTLYAGDYTNRNLIEAIANYYANSSHGIWSSAKITYELEYAAIKATLGTVEDYDYLEPGYLLLYNGDLCTITNVDKNPLKCKTKITMVKY